MAFLLELALTAGWVEQVGLGEVVRRLGDWASHILHTVLVDFQRIS